MNARNTKRTFEAGGLKLEVRPGIMVVCILLTGV